ERYVDQALLDAVAAEHRRGRLLLVATTDLDLERGVVWNMGAIAVEGGLGALPLFRDVLIASASVPGVFPPVLISAEGPGGVFEEMHVDGGVLNWFVALAGALWAWEGPADAMAGARVHVIINGKARSGFRVTRDAPVAVLSRSLDAMMKAEVRSNLAGNRAFARRHGLEFRAAVIPDSVDIGNGFDFSPETRRLIYELGYFRAVWGEAWTDLGATAKAPARRSSLALTTATGAAASQKLASSFRLALRRSSARRRRAAALASSRACRARGARVAPVGESDLSTTAVDS